MAILRTMLINRLAHFHGVYRAQQAVGPRPIGRGALRGPLVPVVHIVTGDRVDQTMAEGGQDEPVQQARTPASDFGSLTVIDRAGRPIEPGCGVVQQAG